ncbi:hypothetical protein [Occallatibacter savannae]|uniref:hypothetical protein n=1 Tax=Occallatibacter savannae TaxID=1002691 RepID=UPI000D69BA88|nr:hypothetical protein [Occallatibacter savannae]
MLEQMTKPENLMAATWTQAALVRRAFNAGPKRKSDRKFDDLEEAVLAAYSSFLDLRKEMLGAGLSSKDVRAALVLMTAIYDGPPINAGALSLLTVPDTIKELPELLRTVERRAKNGDMAPLGVAFWQRDRDPAAKAEKAVWVQSWLVGDRATRAVVGAREAFRDSDGRETDGQFEEK